MKTRELYKLGIPKGPAMQIAAKSAGKAAESGMDHRDIREQIAALVEDLDGFIDHPIFGDLASNLKMLEEARLLWRERPEPAPYQRWGKDIEEGALDQMRNAVRLPIAVKGALMPDAHQGYGLPIGGVLGTRGAVIPYAVGVDIACRMKMTVLDLPLTMLDNKEHLLRSAIDRECRFGIGAEFKDKRQHDVLDEDWSVSPITKEFKNKAWKQLGSSGSGNHFVEFGELTLAKADLGLEAGSYLALLSHSGSRGTGANVASHYSKLAKTLRPELPRLLTHLAWLDMDSQEGNEYWAAMSLMGKYAEANHACIHREIVKNLGAEVLLDVENHHNYAWKEEHDGEELIVHRKGATPAGKGVIGIIPGSMGTPGFVVRGKGKKESLNSAAHGAGRRMSRTAAKKAYNWKDVNEFLDRAKVKLMSAGLDEVPMAYKNIEEVMAQQADLVDIVARFDPRLVKMAQAGERPED